MSLLLSYSWRNVLARKRSTFVTVLGVALSVLVFVMMSATAAGISRVAASTGDPANVLVFSQGAPSAEASSLARPSIQWLRFVDGVARDARGETLASVEALLVKAVPRKGAALGESGEARYTPIRGVTAQAFAVHPRVSIVEGRMPRAPGEVLIGRLLPTKLGDLGLGDEVAFGRQRHVVVGIIEAGGQIFEGEIWADLDDLMSEMALTEPSLVVLRVAGPTQRQHLIDTLERSKNVAVDAKPEPEYYANIRRASVGFSYLGNMIGAIMGLGAIFAGANTMYAAMARRIREVGTLRALGFGRYAVGAALLTESAVVGLLGGALGLAGSQAFDGYGMALFEIAFRLDVTLPVMLAGAGLGLGAGILGGCLPAHAAARLEIVAALRHV